MIQFIYIWFFWLLVFEVLVFCFLNLPSPRGWKGKVIFFLNTSPTMNKIMKLHLACSLIAFIFLIDCYTTQSKFQKEKHQITHSKDRHMATQLRRGYLSYTILKIQRNQYITFLLIYTSLSLNIYIQLLSHMYKKRQKYQLQYKLKQNQNQKQKQIKSGINKQTIVNPPSSSS